ncbi:MAG: DUF3598 domain-containing protein [Parasphingorhabdus sp.]|uniref:DUF3598 domain-containing protein n=1 Tax=Parasphingorhabdus sp. TaxID=2709688 RepID=UPI0032974AC6
MGGTIEDAMPLLVRHVGVWQGEYVHLDSKNREIDRHRSTLICRLTAHDATEQLVQSNIYDWPNQTREVRYFKATLSNDRLIIENENIVGWVAPLSLDQTQRTVMVAWTKTDDPSFRYYEMITLAEDGNSKSRTWHWYHNGMLVKRTLVDEKLISRDWATYDDPSYYQYIPRGAR